MDRLHEERSEFFSSLPSTHHVFSSPLPSMVYQENSPAANFVYPSPLFDHYPWNLPGYSYFNSNHGYHYQVQPHPIYNVNYQQYYGPTAQVPGMRDPAIDCLPLRLPSSSQQQQCYTQSRPNSLYEVQMSMSRSIRETTSEQTNLTYFRSMPSVNSVPTYQPRFEVNPEIPSSAGFSDVANITPSGAATSENRTGVDGAINSARQHFYNDGAGDSEEGAAKRRRYKNETQKQTKKSKRGVKKTGEKRQSRRKEPREGDTGTCSQVAKKSSSKSKEKLYKCDECGKVLSRRETLVLHRRLHTGERPFACLICGKKFTAHSILKSHQITHGKHKTFPCKICGKFFARPSSLKTHQILHLDSKPFQCEFCDKGFNQKALLEAHRRRHTGDTTYKCGVCEKVFIRSNSLVIHKRIHTDERPYACYCGKAFRTSGHLRRHKKIHSKDRTHAVEKTSHRGRPANLPVVKTPDSLEGANQSTEVN